MSSYKVMAELESNPADQIEGQICEDGAVGAFLHHIVSEAVDLVANKGDRFMDHLESFGFGPKRKDSLHEPSSCKDLREALEKGKADANSVNHTQNAPIHSLVKRKAKSGKDKMKLLVTLLTFGDVDIDMLNGDGNTALHLAVMMGEAQLIKVLIAFGANINAHNSVGQTPLNLVSGSHRSRVSLLHLNLGACKPRFSKQDINSSTEALPPTPTRRLISVLAIGSGVEQCTTSSLSPKMVDKVKKLLSSVGTEERPVVGFKRIQVSPRFAGSIDMSSRAVEMESHELPEIRYQYNYKLHEILRKSLTKLADQQLSQSPEDSTYYLLEHMKEAKLLQMAGSRILFLDGGGLKTLIQVEILSQLEEQTGRRVIELFDWIVGTSAGGLLALGLVYGKKSLSDMRKFYFKARKDVFKDPQGGLKFDSKKLESMLKEIFGNKRMCDVEDNDPRVIVTATCKKTANLKLHLFSSIADKDGGVFFNGETEVWKVARYTSAAPIFFTELDDYVDGGILAQNPSAVGLTAIQKYFHEKRQKLPISLVVSIGSGKVCDESAQIGDINATEVLCFGPRWLKDMGELTDRIRSLSTLLSNAITESEIVSENCRFRCEEQGITYYRFNPTTSQVIPPGETDLKILVDMIVNTRTYTVDNVNFHKLVLCFEKIKDYRKRLSASYSEKMCRLLSSYKNRSY